MTAPSNLASNPGVSAPVTPVATPTATPVTTAAAQQAAPGVAGTPDTITSAAAPAAQEQPAAQESAGQENRGILSSIYSGITYPFRLIASLFSAIGEKIANLFGGEDRRTMVFIRQHLASMNEGNNLRDALEKFDHLSSDKKRLTAFQIIQNASAEQVSDDVVRSFYSHFTENVRNHIEGHIFVENNRQDEGLTNFGQVRMQSEPRGELARRAVTVCVSERRFA